MADEADNIINKMLDEVSAFVHPIVNIKSRLAIGIEILLRGKEKNSTCYVSAASFLQKISSLDEYNAITMRLLDLVIEDISNRSFAHITRRPLFISFNIIPKQLMCSELVARLIRFQAELPKGICLLIELLEGNGKELDDDITEVIAVLTRHGIKFAIDDFGNNSICLKYLEALHLDVLKIDISMACVKRGKLIYEKTLQSLVHLAEKLNILLIAEGVETKEQLTLLSECGIENVQGFYYSRPYPLETLSL